MSCKFGTDLRLSDIFLFFLFFSTTCFGVSSRITRHSSSSDLLKGRIEKVVIGSRGTIQLGRAADSLISFSVGSPQDGVQRSPEHAALITQNEQVWSINSIVVSGGTVYFGTSPNGGIYKYSLGKLTRIYPSDSDPSSFVSAQGEESLHAERRRGTLSPSSTLRVKGAAGEDVEVEDEDYLSNEHIFAMATDVTGRLLAGISGKGCRLCRFGGDASSSPGMKAETIFEPDPNDAKYIFAIAVGEGGSIFLGTGPGGKIYKLDSLGKNAKLLYDSRDKNILSLAVGRDGYIYAGSDGRGLIYKIHSGTGKATVLYDSDQPEITALLFGSDSNLYTAATSAKIVQTQTQFAASTFSRPSPGRPEPEAEEEPEPDESFDSPSAPLGVPFGRVPMTAQDKLKRGNGDRKLEIANTKVESAAKPAAGPPPVRKGAKPDGASHIYKISADGFVTDVFAEQAVFFCLAEQAGKLLVGTGNNANLFDVDPAAEQQAMIYEDEQAAQITAIAPAGDDVYLGFANPAKLITLGSGYAAEGTYTSDLIDADQPATWGKLQLEADIPQGCRVLVSARSGNVKDVNDPTFSQWSEPAEMTGPVQLQCPLGRFCQYKLILQSRYGAGTPLIREIAVACTVPNLAPQVESVTVSRIKSATKEGAFKISYVTKDDNDDKLVYKIDFRKIGRMNWIELKDELEAGSFEWDGKTAEDGRYEIRVTASDAKSNTTLTKLTGSRISEPVVVDNTGPVVQNMKITAALKDDGQYRILGVEVADELSAIGKLEYTIDSNADWISTVPDDLVYDTTDENFTIRIDAEKELPKGDHVLTVRVSDAVGNTTYKSLEVNVN